MPSLDNTRESSLSMYIEMPILILMALGTVFVFSASANISSSYDLQQFYNFTTLKQLLFFPLAVGLMYIVSRIDYNRFSIGRGGYLRSFSPYLLVTAIALLTLVLIPGIGVEKNFARRWLSIPLGPASISFQPSELAKWSMVIFLAALLDSFGDSIKQYKRRFLPVCAITGVVCVLIVTQDFGTAAFIACLTFIMLLIAGARWWHFLTPLPVILPALYFAIMQSPHRIERLRAFFITDSASPATYHAQQSLIAVSTGGMWGKGLGEGISKYGHLPEDTTDFIFAIISEELGFAGSFTVIALFAIMVIASVILIRRCNSVFGRMLASGIIITIALQAVVNMGVVTVVLPTKGIPLPFVSAGGTSLLLSAAAAGVLLNIARQTACENRLSSSFERIHKLLSKSAAEPEFVSHTVTVLDASSYKTTEESVLSTRWAPFAEADDDETYDIYEDGDAVAVDAARHGVIEDEVDISDNSLAYDEAVSMDGIAEEISQVDTEAIVSDCREDLQTDAVSVEGNVGAMVPDDVEIEDKPVISNPLFEIVTVERSGKSSVALPAASDSDTSVAEGIDASVAKAAENTVKAVENAVGDFLFDAELESKANRAANAISWDEEEDPDDVWMPGSSSNSIANKNFWETD